MTPRSIVPLAILLVVIAVAAYNTLFIVSQREQAIVLQFGAPQAVYNQTGVNRPGVYAKAPFVQNVIRFDKRNLALDLPPETIVASDQEQLVVDAYARFRIKDPLLFYQRAGSEEVGRTRLQNIMTAALRRVLGGVVSNDIVSGRRGELMRAIAADMNAQAAPLGVEILDVRIRQADLPDETAERVYARMRTEREQVAAEIRAKGEEQAQRIRAEADREVTVTLATANEEGQKIRGAGDAERARIFAQSFGRDPEFAAFYRSMQAYEAALPEGTQMVIPPDGEFFRYMRDRDGR